MSLRKRPSQKRSQEMVQSILTGAMRVLSNDKKSFSTITIAHETGISVGSLYQYFKDKESILKELINSFSLKQNQEIITMIESFPKDLEFEEYINRLLITFYKYIFNDLYLTHNIEMKAKEFNLYHLIVEMDNELIEGLYQALNDKMPSVSIKEFKVMVNLIKALNNPLMIKDLSEEDYIYYSKKIIFSIIGIE
jgi:AcrR family transcriptional regulator